MSFNYVYLDSSQTGQTWLQVKDEIGGILAEWMKFLDFGKCSTCKTHTINQFMAYGDSLVSLISFVNFGDKLVHQIENQQ